jgi:hypothetical protein
LLDFVDFVGAKKMWAIFKNWDARHCLHFTRNLSQNGTAYKYIHLHIGICIKRLANISLGCK